MKRFNLFYLFVMALFVVVLTACGGNDATSGSSSDESKTSGNAKITVSDYHKFPSILPSDIPFPEDGILGIFGDSEDQGQISVNTQVTLDELETWYDDYFETSEFADRIEKVVYDGDDKSIIYQVIEDDFHFYTKISEREDHRAVHLYQSEF